MKIVTQADKRLMNELYKKLGTYAAVSREVGFSPSTVKRYIDPEFQSDDGARVKKVYDRPLPTFDFDVAKQFIFQNWDEMCKLSDEEADEIEELWGELDL